MKQYSDMLRNLDGYVPSTALEIFYNDNSDGYVQEWLLHIVYDLTKPLGFGQPILEIYSLDNREFVLAVPITPQEPCQFTQYLNSNFPEYTFTEDTYYQIQSWLNSIVDELFPRL